MGFKETIIAVIAKFIHYLEADPICGPNLQTHLFMILLEICILGI